MRTSLSMLVIASAAACARDAQPAQTTPAVAAAPAPTAAADPHAGQGSHAGHGSMMHGGAAGGANTTYFVDPGSGSRNQVQQGIAVMFAPDGKRMGTVRFAQSDKGLDVRTEIANLPPGKHAYHVHVFGDCSTPDLKSAGPHFHFTGSSFDKDVKIITGNLGELEGDGEGRVTHQAQLPEASLQGSYSLLGRAVIIHAKGNDPTKPPDGGAGDRIACGVIGIADQPAGTPTAQR